MSKTEPRPQLLTVAEAARLLEVSDRTIRRWIKGGRIPYVELPSGSYRIPQAGLLASLRGTYDLANALGAPDERSARLPEGGEQGTGHPPAADPWRDNELARRRRLQATGRRPLGVNLAEGLALSELLSSFTGDARS